MNGPESGSSGWPGHLASTDNVNVHVGNTLSRVGSVVDDHPESFVQVKLTSHLPGNQQKVPKQLAVFLDRFFKAGYRFLWDDQDMCRALWVDVVDDEGEIVLIGYLGGNLAGENAFE
jgi:hypothetical protein